MVPGQPIASILDRAPLRALFADKCACLIADDRGQATLEYILILSVAVVAAGAMARAILGALDRGVLRLGGALEKDLKTGRMPVEYWR